MKNALYLSFFLFFLPSSLKAQETTDSLSFFIQNFQFKNALRYIDNQEETKQNKFQKAMCYKALGENREAMRILEEMNEEYPENINVKTELASSYERASRWRETSNTYANLMAIDSTNLYFAIKKSEAEINTRNYKQGIKDLELVLSKDTLPNAIRLLGKSYESINKVDSAIYYYNLAVTIDSLDAFSSSNLVNAHLKNKNYGQALSTVQHFLEYTPNDKSLNMLHGYTYYALEDYENAASTLEKCFLMGDSSLVVNRSLGISYYYTGDSECAYTYLKKAYAQDTTHAVVNYNLAITAREMGDYDLAIKLHEGLLERLIPSNVQLYLNYYYLGETYDKKENYADAAKNYIKALEYATTDQRLSVLSPLAAIYDGKLSNSISDVYTSLNYYNQYRSGLIGLISFMKNDEATSVEVIVEYESQLKDLNEHIATLEAKVAKDKKENPPITDKDIMYVLEGKIVDYKDFKPDNEKGKPIMRRYTSKENNPASILERDKAWIAEAKKLNKRLLVILDYEKNEKVEN